MNETKELQRLPKSTSKVNKIWYDGQKSTTGSVQAYHVLEATNDTILDSLLITGDFHGWIHSLVVKSIHPVIDTVPYWEDTLFVRFAFVSDCVGNSDGWQIDDLCLWIQPSLSSRIEKTPLETSFYTNPCNGNFNSLNSNSNGVLMS